jgi:hypothetical protein
LNKVKLFLVLAVPFALIYLIAACGHSGANHARITPDTGAALSVTTQEALEQIDTLAKPNGVDAALWDELKGAFRTALQTRDDKITSTPPTGEANRINDLAIADSGDGTYKLNWHYRNAGDYDQDGVVGVTDIVPLSQHFGESVFNLNSTAALIDTRDRGRVSVSDITAIARSLGIAVSKYRIETADLKEGPYSQAGEMAFAQGTGKEAGRLVFAWELLTPAVQHWYRVVPVDAQDYAGEPSLPAIWPEERSRWWTQNKDAQRTGVSGIVGPETPALKWHYQSGASAFGPPVVAADGTVYVGAFDDILHAVDADGNEKWSLPNTCYSNAAPTMTPEGSILAVNKDSMMYLLSPDGSVEWEFEAGNPSGTNPIIALDGAIYIGTRNEALLAVTPEGLRKWTGAYGGSLAGPSITADGRILMTNELGGGGILSAFTPGRRPMWEYRVGKEIRRSPISAPDGTIYAISLNYDFNSGYRDGLLDAINVDGTRKWRHEFPTFPGISDSSLNHYLLALGKEGTIYIVMNFSDPYVCRLNAYNPDGTKLWQSVELVSYSCRDLLIDGAGNAYLACDRGGDVIISALRPDGTLIWEYPVDGNSYLAMGDDGTLFVATNTGSLYAIGDAGA